MDANEQIKKFGEFFEHRYINEIRKKIRKGEKFIVIDFSELSGFDHELADELLEQPEEVIKAGELAVMEFELPENMKNFRLRFANLPEDQKIMIRNIRSEHINKFLVIDGVVRQKSDVRPQVTSAKFECPSCGNIINILQLDSSFKEPTRCGCGRKGKFRLLDKELVDAQGIVLEESPEDLEGGEQPKRLNVLLKNDLVSPLSERKTNPGSYIRVFGQIKEVPIILRTGVKSTKFDLLVEANYIEPKEENFYDIEINEEEEKKIIELSKNKDIDKKLIKSIAPSIYGYEKVKEALILQLMGGVQKQRKDGIVTRGDMHILLVGDPGCGKCTDGKSKIILEDGEITTIQSFYEENVSFNNLNEPNKMKIFSINEDGLNFTSQPIRFWRRKAPKKMIKIITNTGNELIITKEHPLFTTNAGLIFAKKADKYNIGEFIATPSKVNVEGSIQTIPKDIIYTKVNNRVKYKIKVFFDQEFARLFGYLTGEGYVRIKKTSGIISFTNNNKELLDDFEYLIKKAFNLKVSKRKKQNTDSYEYYISSIDLVRILEKIDSNIIKKSENMCINKTIAKSPDWIVKEFLRSLFDCGGCVNNSRRRIEFSSKSKNLIFDIKYMLLRFGIVSQVSPRLKCASNTVKKIKRPCYELRISGESIIKFYNKIGFISNTKQRKLEFWAKSKKKLNTNMDIVPHLKELLMILRKKYNLTQFSFPVIRSTYQHYEKGDRNPSYNKLREICKMYNGLNKNDPLIKILNQITNTDVFWDKIKTIEEIDYDQEFVYDLEIEKIHNFVANGIVVHNSQLLKRIQKVAPKGRYVSGKGVSGAGLTASVVKDEFLRGWSLEAGALVLASNGICCIDEMDKMSHEDRGAMHEALEQQTVSISKANIQATLLARTTVLAAANPKFGRFDPYDILAKQIDLPPTLINRFDLIFPIKDLPDKNKDEEMASHILNLHMAPEFDEPEIPTEVLRKYIAYARQKRIPKLTSEAEVEIRNYYVEMRNKDSGEEGAIRTIPISARQLEALVRLGEASARVRLDTKVTKKDAIRAINLLQYCLSQIGVDPETGKIDIDRIATGVTASQRSKIIIVKEIIDELENKIGKTIPIDDLIKEVSAQGVGEGDIEDVIEKLKRSGDIFEPKRGFIQKI
jgi:replicative DNA helicase Mcm